MINPCRASIVCALLITSEFAVAQQDVQHLRRIICTPPSGNLVKMVKPVFPPEAKGKGIFGIVVVEAEIDKTGTLTGVKRLNGNPVLADAVLDAVKKWRWRPYKLNGAPVAVETTISVHFEPL